MAPGGGVSSMVLDSEESKNVAVVHKTNQGYSGKDLWKLKQERPDLFNLGVATSQQGGSQSSKTATIPTGFRKVVELPGWLYNPQLDVYMNGQSQYVCRDAATGDFYDLHRGEDIGSSLSIRGDAAAVVGRDGSSSRHVVINDLHRAASSMKLDLGHLDSPAAMYAVYDGQLAAGGSSQAELAAKSLHVKLLPRLAAYRGSWDDEKLERTLTDAITTLTNEIGAAERGGVSVAIALLLGRRLCLAASRTGVCILLDPEDEHGSAENDIMGQTGAAPSARCVDLALHEGHLGVLLTVDAVSSTLAPSRVRSLLRPHIVSDRVKAACVALLGEAQKAGAAPPVVAAGVRIAWSQQDGDAPPAKRARTAPTKVRCRHILLRHTASQIAASERVKKKPTRTTADAEAMMLNIFGEITRGDMSAFTSQCRSLSECDSSLRGGDLAGDIGWVDKDTAKNKKVPATVVRAAFGLEVGQLSDLVSSEKGVHLVLRTA